MSEQAPVPEQAGEPKQGHGGKIAAIIVIILVIAGGVYAFVRRDEQTAPPAANETDITSEPAGTANAGAAADQVSSPTGGEGASGAVASTDQPVIITHADSGYSPQAVTIKKGAAVTFKNESANATWPASAMHPTHTVYPGSGLDKCGTGEQSTIFDACRGLATGESWSFKFDNAGSWKYHDHLTPTHFGAIEVTE